MKTIKKWLMHILTLIGISLVFWYLTYIWQLAMEAKNHLIFYEMEKHYSSNEEQPIFEVYHYDLLKRMFLSLEEAQEYAGTLKRSYVIQMGKKEWLWDNYSTFIVYKEQRYMKDFEDFVSALEYAKKHKNSKIAFQTKHNIIWSKEKEIFPQKQLEVPLVQQLPELARGCEVTSLTMLLQYKGIEVDKLTLAEQIKKDPTPYEKKDGKIYFGNPYKGFVGDIYTHKNPGYGVYHGPIYELLQSYVENPIDLTGSELEDLLYFVNEDIPVWVVTNTRYRVLQPEDFQTWYTEQGAIQVTRRQHAAVITGYDEKYIYINDPLHTSPNYSIEKPMFEKVWKQMGSQAVTYLP